MYKLLELLVRKMQSLLPLVLPHHEIINNDPNRFSDSCVGGDVIRCLFRMSNPNHPTGDLTLIIV
jgi:hypothetical protein